FGSRVQRYLDDQETALASARKIANDETASAEERASALGELEVIRTRLEQHAPTHIERLLSFAVDPTADQTVQRISRQFFVDLNWLREDDFLLQTKSDLRMRVVAIMKAQGRWPDEVD
ncbi:MAG: hypothetical protein ACRDHN_02060, partial [Thermomicrobiales bacterium]